MTAISIIENKANEVKLPRWLQECLISHNPEQSESDEALICKAFNFAYKLHEGQYRKSGDHYIAHPIAVASLLRGSRWR